MRPARTIHLFSLYLGIQLLLLGCTITATAAESSRFITIILPAPVIEQAIKQSLPLPINTRNKNIKGTVTVDSITNLRLYKNALSLQAHLTGRNMKVTTNIAGRNIALNVGTVSLPISADFLLRFDRKKKTLFVKPQVKPPTKPLQASNPADMLQLLIQGFSNREYPIALDDLQPLVAQVGSHQLTVHTQLQEVNTADNKLVMKLTPRIQKTR